MKHENWISEKNEKNQNRVSERRRRCPHTLQKTSRIWILLYKGGSTIRLIPQYLYIGCDLKLFEQNKMSAFQAQNPTQTCVWRGQKPTPHYTKNRKEKRRRFPRFFAFLVWCGVIWTWPVPRCSSFGQEKRTFYSALVIPSASVLPLCCGLWAVGCPAAHAGLSCKNKRQILSFSFSVFFRTTFGNLSSVKKSTRLL